MLTKHLSLSQRVKLTFIVSFVVLSIFSMVLVFAAVKTIEDHIFEAELDRTIKQYQLAVIERRAVYLPPEISVYSHKKEIPAQFSQYMNESNVGIYELEHPDNLDYHYAIVNSNDNNKLFFIYDVNDVELSEDIESKVLKFIFFGFIILFVIFFLIFQTVVKRALAPMYQLIEQVKKQAEQPESIIDYNYPEDAELGLLNKTLKNHSQRIESFFQREREFSSFASHELRTPVTIIKGATELLQLHHHDNVQFKKPLERISRATKNMEDMIELLLSLSREQRRTESQLQAVDLIFKQTLCAFHDKALQHQKFIEVIGELSPDLDVEKIAAQIIFTNMIKNAIQHSSSAEITIRLNRNTCSISNNIQLNQPLKNNEINDSLYEQGYGLGKLIIDRICQQQDWQYQEWIEGDSYFVQIDYS